MMDKLHIAVKICGSLTTFGVFARIMIWVWSGG